MSIATEITRLNGAKSALKTAINNKNDANHQIANETIDQYATYVGYIPTGGETYVKDLTSDASSGSYGGLDVSTLSDGVYHGIRKNNKTTANVVTEIYFVKTGQYLAYQSRNYANTYYGYIVNGTSYVIDPHRNNIKFDGEVYEIYKICDVWEATAQ